MKGIMESGLSDVWNEEAFQRRYYDDAFHYNKRGEREGKLQLETIKNKLQNTQPASDLEEHINSLNVSNLLGIFYLLLFGLFTANLILATEKILFGKFIINTKSKVKRIRRRSI